MDAIEVLPPEQPDGVFSPDDLAVLNENRRLRKMLIGQLIQGNKIPDDKADKTLLVNLLNGMDAEVISRARVKVAAKTEAAMTDVRHLVAQALIQHNSRSVTRLTARDFEPPSHIGQRETVPGELEVGVINLTMDDIEEN